jgi:hypothetical protein
MDSPFFSPHNVVASVLVAPERFFFSTAEKISTVSVLEIVQIVGNSD